MTLPGSPAEPASTPSQSLPSAAGQVGTGTPTALYRFFDTADALLYVGIAADVEARWKQHSRDHADTWWPLVSSNTVQWFQSRPEALRAERTAITVERPLHNVMHTARDRTARGKRSERSKGAERLYQLLTQIFGTRHFTSADAAGSCRNEFSKSSVTRALSTLVEEGHLVVMGTRHVLPPYGPRRDLTLYAVAHHEWVDAEGNPLSEVPAEPPALPRRRRVPVQHGSTSRQGSPAPRDLPPVVTFQSGADLLVQLGIVDSISHQGVRHIAQRENWPFGDDRPHAYWSVGASTVMATGPFLDYFREHPPTRNNRPTAGRRQRADARAVPVPVIIGTAEATQ